MEAMETLKPFIKRFILGFSRPVLNRVGYGVFPRRMDIVVESNMKDRQFYKEWATCMPVFTPWAGHPEFQEVYEGIAPYTLVGPESCYILASLARHASQLDGEFAECGVFKGGTALLLSRILKGQSKTLYLFDSFKGLPARNKGKDNAFFHEGKFAIDSVESVRQLLTDYLDRVVLLPGWIPDTFAGLDPRLYAFAHLDVDLYQSTLDCCKYFYPRLVAGGVLLFDEYGLPPAIGERDAVDEFFADKRESPIALPTGQAFVLKLPP